MELTRKADYAVSVLTELAAHVDDGPMQSKEVAVRRSIPENLVAQIVSMLGKQGWVEGTRGVGGGIRLAADPAQISVLDVVEMVEGPVHVNLCTRSDSACPNESTCPVHPVWVKAEKAFTDVLRTTTIADLAKRH
jgi:Rrf2 family iron-sulfur cluster assembly transcriptional regulator